ncbi:23 kDa integral membrane protein-like isoform X2 [Pectinophora gossypiella]|uniref:23 kDa integral membrane protein-like isoform X2 n=1 Tax=Pectinophora gossypiella TaxID=13191 RepID=UPI00214F1982|nr:23 kDa integral membrane protein-like isoform X2 [Pectinophora gossypiella]
MLLAIITFAAAVVDIRIMKHGEVQETGTLAGNIAVIVVSLLLIAVALLGCIGVVKEKPKLLYVYAGFLMIIVVLSVMSGIFVAVQRCGLQLDIRDWMREDFFMNVTGEELIEHNKKWDKIQINYECCGLNGPEDYKAMHQDISMACCPRAHRAQSEHAKQMLYKACLNGENHFYRGCEEVVIDYVQSDADWLLGMAVISFWFEAACMVLAVSVANHLKNRVTVYQDTVKY